MCRCFLPEDLGDFLRENLRVRISLEEQPSPTIIQAVTAGQVDIGVVAAEGGLAGLETQAYRRDRLVLIVPVGHPLAGRAQPGGGAIRAPGRQGHDGNYSGRLTVRAPRIWPLA